MMGGDGGHAEPSAYEGEGRWSGVRRVVIAGAVGTAAMIVVPVFLGYGQTMGATRSARLEWEQRRTAIEEAIAEEAAEADSTGPRAGQGEDAPVTNEGP